ncbi:MAG: helix-turn-helix domain-containing protein [Clostridia bacterium]|nr:helix-turn-helix domain-containing protein [Clostridia bacterium]
MFFNEDDLPAILTFAEAREYLYISRNTLLNLLHNKDLNGFKVGNQWRIRKEDLIEFTKKDRWD